MLNEFIGIFLGAYHQYVNPDYVYIDYFDSVISVIVIALSLAGALAMALVTASGTFKIIRGVFGRD